LARNLQSQQNLLQGVAVLEVEMSHRRSLVNATGGDKGKGSSGFLISRTEKKNQESGNEAMYGSENGPQ